MPAAANVDLGPRVERETGGVEAYSVDGVATALLRDGSSAVIPTDGRPVGVDG